MATTSSSHASLAAELESAGVSEPERVAAAFAREECTTLAAVAELTPAVFDKLVASMDVRALSESRLRKLVEDARTPVGVAIGVVIAGHDDVESATPAPAPATVVLTGPPAPAVAASVETGTRTRWIRSPGGGWVRQVVAAVAKSDFTSPVGTRWAIKGGGGASGGGGNAGAGSSTRRLTLERTPDARAPGEAGGRHPGDGSDGRPRQTRKQKVKLAASILGLPCLFVLFWPVCGTWAGLDGGCNMGVFAVVLLCVAALFECSALGLVYGKAYLWCEDRGSNRSRLGGCLACALTAAGVVLAWWACSSSARWCGYGSQRLHLHERRWAQPGSDS
jgi:hypothetical protein